jgi:hypothetical protein
MSSSTGRASPKSLYDDALVTFEDDRGAYDQKDAAGFIRLNALRLRTLAARNREGAGHWPQANRRDQQDRQAGRTPRRRYQRSVRPVRCAGRRQ